MTGPEHYREAEVLLAAAQNAPEGARPSGRYEDLVAEAQAHATLALAAATIDAARVDRARQWDGVLS